MSYKIITICILFLINVNCLFGLEGQAKDNSLLLDKNSHFTRINEVRVHYKMIEPSQSPVGNIVLIHGFAASTFSWRNNMDFLADKGYRVVAIDMPGYGYSEKQRSFDHSHESRAKITWQLIDSISSEKWILIGHSMGGGTAGYMAAINPDQTEKLVMANGVFGEMQDTPGRFLGRYLVRFPVFYHLIEGISKAFVINQERFEEHLSSAYGEDADSIAVAGYIEPFKIEGSSVAVIETFLRGFDETPPDLNKIIMPVLLIWGENDTWVPVETGHDLHSVLENSKMEVISNAGHNPMETHPDAFNEKLLRFLSNSN